MEEQIYEERMLSRPMKAPIFLPSSPKVYKMVENAAFEYHVKTEELIPLLYDALLPQESLSVEDKKKIRKAMDLVGEGEELEAIDSIISHLKAKLPAEKIEANVSSLQQIIFHLTADLVN